MSDESLTLWQRLREGDDFALEAIFLLHHKDLFRYGFKIAMDKAMVDDCIQDLFLELWKNRSRVSPTLSGKAYLMKALKYKIYRALRKEVQTMGISGSIEMPAEFSYEAALVQQEEQSELRNKLLREMNKLSPRQQEALYLRYYSQLSYAEISELMAISPQAATNLVFKSIKALRENFHFLYLLA
ncbi:RNA polymerase sigma factor [Flavihumibacter petaseus]|uniref:Putative RNA polymerase sigma factor n=1 Tax=Flavihumibacter petaseus NBRC 106054 TaxID=1220578 RepID=A0A0E9MWN4_9BACT|nr:sigma-70 family RNA polymerase sigma factor [Flavihumibacter petaseus]GAO41520.1 putative RNA polymerase sigma factor [Flavihumibacter petaseus NBRC 106054]